MICRALISTAPLGLEGFEAHGVESVFSEKDQAINYAGGCDAGIRVYDDAGNVIAAHEHAGDFKDW
jgi:hypothetical protein